jgi:hypothetical protein
MLVTGRSVMRKITLQLGILLLLPMLSTAIFAETPDADGFYAAKWGMSVSQVREIFNFARAGYEVRSTQTGNETVLTAVAAENMLACKVGISFVFNFRDDALYMATYSERYPLPPWFPGFTKEEKSIPECGGQMLSRYKNEEDSLYKKYGGPAKSDDYDKIWVLPSTSIAARFIRLEGKSVTIYHFSLEYKKR